MSEAEPCVGAPSEFADAVADAVVDGIASAAASGGGGSAGATPPATGSASRKLDSELAPAERNARLESILNAHLAHVLAHSRVYSEFALRCALRQGPGVLCIQYSSIERMCTAEECALSWLPAAACGGAVPGLGPIVRGMAVGHDAATQFACLIGVSVDVMNRGWHAAAVVRYAGDAPPGVFKFPPRTDVLDYDPLGAAAVDAATGTGGGGGASDDVKGALESERRYVASLRDTPLPPPAEWAFVDGAAFKAACASSEVSCEKRERGVYGKPMYVDDYAELMGRAVEQDMLLPCTACDKHETTGWQFDGCNDCSGVVYCSERCRAADRHTHKTGCHPAVADGGSGVAECARTAAVLMDDDAARGEVEF